MLPEELEAHFVEFFPRLAAAVDVRELRLNPDDRFDDNLSHLEEQLIDVLALVVEHLRRGEKCKALRFV